MTRKYGLVVLTALLAMALVVAEAQAQGQGNRGNRGNRGGPGGRGGMMGGGAMMLSGLVQNEQVQKELELVDDQKTKITELVAQQRTAMQAFFQSSQDLSQEERQAKMQQMGDDFQKKLADILLPKQMERLKQIQVQAEGPRAFTNADVVKALNLTDDQKSKIKTISDEAQTKAQDAVQGLNGQERRAKMQELDKDLAEKLAAVLTADQTAQLEKLKGPKVDFDLSTIMRGPGRGNRGGAPGGPGNGG
jgi:hypothetical protein